MKKDTVWEKDQSKLYEAIFNHTYQYTGLMDPDGTLIEANETALEFGGISRDDVIGKKIWNTYWFRISQDTQEQTKSDVQRAAEGEFVRRELEVQGADGSIIIDFSIRPISDEQGEVTILIPEGRDITDRKERERELDETARQLQVVLDNAQAAIWIRDTDHRYKITNQNYRDRFGIDESVNLEGRRPDEVLPEDVAAQFRANDQRVIEQEEPIEFEEVVETTEGERTYLTRMVPLYDDAELYATCGVATDITELKRNQEELERINEQLEGLVSIVSHDLRNPLRTASGYLELAREERDSENLEAIERAHERMEALIQDILTLARGGNQVGEVEFVPLRDLVKAAWGIVETADATLAIETDMSVRADASRLQQLLENLIRNAVEHGGRNVKVTVGSLDGGFFVADTGPGIPPEIREDVFEEGFTTNSAGTGFGLTIVKQIADGHGWDVSLTEGSEGGARFEFVDIEAD